MTKTLVRTDSNANASKSTQKRTGCSTTETEFPCSKCANEVRDGENGVACDQCGDWVHAKCAGLSNAVIKVLKENDNIDFTCDQCKVSNRKRVDVLEAKIAELTDTIERRFADLAGKFDSISMDRQTFPAPRAPPLPFSRSAPLPSSPAFTQAVDEVVELKLKSRNAVLFGVPEVEGQNDLTVVRDFLATHTDGNYDTVNPLDVLYTFRDGPKVDGQPRFLKVALVTSQVKQHFITFNKVVKPGSNLPLRSRPDLTYQQRVNGRKLREKLDELGATDHYVDYKRTTIVNKKTKNTVFTLSLS